MILLAQVKSGDGLWTWRTERPMMTFFAKWKLRKKHLTSTSSDLKACGNNYCVSLNPPETIRRKQPIDVSFEKEPLNQEDTHSSFSKPEASSSPKAKDEAKILESLQNQFNALTQPTELKKVVFIRPIPLSRIRSPIR